MTTLIIKRVRPCPEYSGVPLNINTNNVFLYPSSNNKTNILEELLFLEIKETVEYRLVYSRTLGWVGQPSCSEQWAHT